MKHFLNVILSGAVLALLSSCTTQTQETSQMTDTVAVLDTTPIEATQDTTQNALQTITGKVEQVTFGKDGYTAKLTTASKEVYFATISHANLRENAGQYREVKAGDSIEIKGEVWKMGEETHVTVRELK
jgi:hypothetical protein